MEKLNPLGDNGLMFFGYRDSELAMLLFILHEKGEPFLIPLKYRS
jgi:hypothetical protein